MNHTNAGGNLNWPKGHVRRIGAIATLVGVLVTACGVEGPSGEPGPIGPPGEPGVTIPVLAWVDGDDRIVSTSSSPRYVDAEGLRWFVDTDSGEMMPEAAPLTGAGPTGDTQFIFYETPDCMGAGYVLGGVGVGVGFVTCEETGTTIRARGPRDASVMRRLYSQRMPDGAGGCQCVMHASVLERRVFPLPAQRSIPAKPPAFTSPLRLVPIQ